jgi:hypothetical protein
MQIHLAPRLFGNTWMREGVVRRLRQRIEKLSKTLQKPMNRHALYRLIKRDPVKCLLFKNRLQILETMTLTKISWTWPMRQQIPLLIQ